MFEIRAVVPLILLLVKFEKFALLKSVPALMRLYVNVAPVKSVAIFWGVDNDRLALSRMQLIILAFINFTPVKFVPVKS